MSRAVLHLWRRENYAKCEISMSHGNIQANNVIRFKSLRIATPITLCARITETACNINNRFFLCRMHVQSYDLDFHSQIALQFLTYYITVTHDERDGVSNRRRFDGLLKRLLRCRSKKTLKFCSLTFVRGIHRSPHKRPVTQKILPSDDVIMWLDAHFNKETPNVHSSGDLGQLIIVWDHKLWTSLFGLTPWIASCQSRIQVLIPLSHIFLWAHLSNDGLVHTATSIDAPCRNLNQLSMG